MTEWLERVQSELADRYRIERELGRGGAATVYLAEDLAQQRQVAVKVLHPELVEAVGGQRFLREIRLAASLHHPHLLTIHSWGETRGLFYFVAPYLPDGSLRTYLKRERQLSVDEALRITREVGDALGHVHEHGIVHRDVKPENILFAGKHACVADFGIARAVETAVGDTLTSTGLVLGTPAYMSPEQASGERAVDARSDQYSLACVLYEMLAGMPPFVGATAQSVIAQRFAHAPSPLTFYRPIVPPAIELAISRALAIAPADRFDSVRDFVAALDRPAAPVIPIDPNVRLRKLKRRWFVAGASAAVVAIALFGFRQAYESVLASRRAALDTSRFVVLPFADSAGVTTLSGANAAEAAHAALSQWKDLEVVPAVTVQDRLDERGTRISSLKQALDVAAGLGAGRAIWGRIVGPSGTPNVRLALYDVPYRRAVRELGLVPLAGDTAERVIAAMTNRVLRGSEFTAGAETGELGTRRLTARRAYERGHAAFASGDFAAAAREFSTAAGLDNSYVHANLWAATSGLLLDTGDGWQESARRAFSGRSQLNRRESTLAAALFAMAEQRYVDACVGFDGMRRLDSLEFLAWYGAGECRYRDSAVVRSTQSPSGWAFRSSHHTAVQAYFRAIEMDPHVYTLPVHVRLGGMLKTQMGRVRFGHDDEYVAVPELAGDTLAYWPYPVVEGSLTGPSGNREARVRAVDRDADRLLEFARGWAKHEPQRAEALHAVAAALEAKGELSEIIDRSALTFIRRARALPVAPHAGLELATREVRLLVKAGHFNAGRALADTLLGTWRNPDASAAELLVGLAALTGRVATVARLGAMLHPEEVAGVRLSSTLREKAAALNAYAAVGICDRIPPLYADLLSAIDGQVGAENAAVVKSELVADAAQWAAPCKGVSMGGRAASRRWPILRAKEALESGQLAEARAVLGTIIALRGFSPAGVSLDYSFRNAWLLVALGDTAEAIRRLDLSLRGLVAQRSSLVTRPVEAAALPRAMALRAELAAARGDRRVAAYWALPALALWRNAHPELAPIVTRLRQLAGM